MFRRLFVDHPKSVDENYLEHFGVAGRFGCAMIWGGTKALVHAVVPAYASLRAATPSSASITSWSNSAVPKGRLSLKY